MPFLKSSNKTESASIIQWDSSFNVGVTDIDQQHQMLISMINELNNGVTQAKSREELGKTIDGLASYAANHFATEEALFSKYDFPWAPTHKADHALFNLKVTGYKNDIKAGKIETTAEAVKFMSDWLKAHIQTKDKAYSYFFTMKGLK